MWRQELRHHKSMNTRGWKRGLEQILPIFVQRDRDPAQTLVLNFSPPELWNDTLLLLQSVQFSSVAQSCPTLCNPMNCSPPGLPVHHNSRSSLRFTSIKSVMPSSHLILCCPFLLLPSIFHSIRVFSNESALHIRWPKYWSFNLSIIPSKEHPGLISFRMD